MLPVLFPLIWFGFEGIVIGVVAGLAMFAVSHARLDAMRASGTGARYASNVLRPPGQLRLLAVRADAIQVIRLQGYLFFGSAHRVLEGVSARLPLPGETGRAICCSTSSGYTAPIPRHPQLHPAHRAGPPPRSAGPVLGGAGDGSHAAALGRARPGRRAGP